MAEKRPIRKIVKIDETLCDGCGNCVPACAEGAIRIEDGKARLIKEIYCDGLGACLGDCPQDAITIEEREADPFDEEAVKKHLAEPAAPAPPATPCSCPGAAMKSFASPPTEEEGTGNRPSQLRQWPIQLHLVSPAAPYYKKADILLAADCTAFSLGEFHRDYLQGRSLAIACPKLDAGQDIYVDKIRQMIDDAEAASLTVMVMQVPCCSGLVQVARQAAAAASRSIPLKAVVVSLQGEILQEQSL